MSSSTRLRAAAAFSRSSTSRMRSASSGTSEAKSMASTTSAGFGTGGVLTRAEQGDALLGVRSASFDHDVAKELGLLRADLPLPAQLDRKSTRLNSSH